MTSLLFLFLCVTTYAQESPVKKTGIKLTFASYANSFWQLSKPDSGMGEQNFVTGGVTFNVLEPGEQWGIFGKTEMFQNTKIENRFSVFVGGGGTYRFMRFFGVSAGIGYLSNAKEVNPDMLSVVGIIKINLSYPIVKNLYLFGHGEVMGNKKLLYSSAELGLRGFGFIGLSFTFFKFGEESSKIGISIHILKDFDNFRIFLKPGISWGVQGNRDHTNPVSFNIGGGLIFTSF